MNSNIFQIYSQKENVITNNTIFFFKRLKHLSNDTYFKFINTIFSEAYSEEINLNESSYTQRSDNSSSIPDATITQDSYKIIFETKLGYNFSVKQLENHLNNFKDEKHKLLITLSPDELKYPTISEITNILSTSNIKHHHLTFKSIIELAYEITSNRLITVLDLIDDFKEYCYSSQLIIDTEYHMRVVPVGQSYEENKKCHIYYSPEGFYRNVGYVGLYINKTIKAIGKVEKIVRLDYDSNKDKLIYISNEKDKQNLSDIQIENIKNAIKAAAKAERNWDISKGHIFYFVENFIETSYVKNTPYGIPGHQYFDLIKIVKYHGSNIENMKNTEDICKFLDGLSWPKNSSDRLID